MKRLFSFCVLMFFWTSIICAQYPFQQMVPVHVPWYEDTNQTIRKQHENKIRDRYSPDLWQDREALQCKKDQVASVVQCIENNQAVADHYKQLHDQAKNLQIHRYSFNDVCSMVSTNPHILTFLKHAWMCRIFMNMKELETLKRISQSDQWQYFNEYKEAHIDHCRDLYDVSSLIAHLERAVDDNQEKFTTSVHAMRSRNIAKSYFHACSSVQNVVRYHTQYLQWYEQEEDMLRDGMLAKFDARIASNEKWMQLTRRLLQRSIENSSREQHKLLQNVLNQEFFAHEQAKQLRLAQEKAERDVMSIEDRLAEYVRYDEQQKFSLQEQAHAEELKLLYDKRQKQALIDAEEQVKKPSARRNRAKREKEKLKKQQVREKEEAITGSIAASPISGEKQDKKVIDNSLNYTVDKAEIYKQFVLDLEFQREERDAHEQALYALPGVTHEQIMATMCKYDQGFQDSIVLHLLDIYTDHVCNDTMTDEKLAMLQDLSSKIFTINEDLCLEHNKHMAWYLYNYKTVSTKIYDRYKALHTEYSNTHLISQMQEQVISKLTFQDHRDEIEMANVHKSFEDAHNAVKKSMQENESESIQSQKKMNMRACLLRLKQQKENVALRDEIYRKFEKMIRDEKVYQIMKKLHGPGCILDIERLSSPDLDIAGW